MEEAGIPRRKTGYRVEDFGDEIVLYDFSTTRVIYLNETASLIWRLCDGLRSFNEIRTVLQQAYPFMRDKIEVDFRTAMEQFIYCGAVEMS